VRNVLRTLRLSYLVLHVCHIGVVLKVKIYGKQLIIHVRYRAYASQSRDVILSYNALTLLYLSSVSYNPIMCYHTQYKKNVRGYVPCTTYVWRDVYY
jgi:hypothetical protein